MIDASRGRATPPKPWIDDAPEPLEAADADQGTVLWRVRTPSAGELFARRVSIPPDQATELIRQLRQLHEVTFYNAESVVGASQQQDSVWILLDPVASCTLGRLLASADASVGQRAILVLDLVAGLAELHAAGVGIARLTERTVIVDTAGRLRLAEPWRLPGESVDRADEVRRACELACRILGVGLRPGGGLTPAEQQAPALVAVARSLAGGSASRASDAFQALREAAGWLGQKENLEPSRSELSRLVKSLSGPTPASATTAQPQPQPRPQAQPQPPQPP